MIPLVIFSLSKHKKWWVLLSGEELYNKINWKNKNKLKKEKEKKEWMQILEKWTDGKKVLQLISSNKMC